ncbi:ABC transporter substrate-binding protein [Actinopolymorpha singaporensis]|uniref:Peptide/nickel transport system substrate-binding protein n=1 Tax=Actinopolymorpha singaporensis TaxID=117157 RepID=A0A1H1NE07_9ACTN|nr:ABC transporter substrate-binding protein [Actinopolymorpha singaporensis]SDR97177.1 peptide/nickel transport system substrate-binding protein [Actinopolymorpha singaporensis]
MRHVPPLLTRAAAVGVALVTLSVAAACGSSGGDDSAGGGNASGGGKFDPAKCQGGTLYVLNQKDITHLDPARLYTSGGGNIPSLLFRTLTTRNRAGGAEGAKVVPDLATNTGVASDDAKTWTYTLRGDLKFSDGSKITSKDVKYGIERSFAPELPGGAPYLRDWLSGAADYQGVYKDPAGIKSIETPDDKTIVFHLRKPEGDFPFLATATQFAPVPKAKDTGVKYENKPVSSGPYQVESYQKNKKLVLTRNPHWSRSVDKNRLACPDRVEITSGLDAAVINQRIFTGAGKDANAVTTDTDLGPSELARLGNDPELDKRVAKGHFPFLYYIAFNLKQKPFDDPKIRQAISYAVSRTSVINAVGGTALADPATTFLPAQKSMGYQKYDYFPAGTNGNPAKAKQLLAEAGHPNGITVPLTYVSDSKDGTGPGAATAVQDALKKAGITVKPQGLETDAFYEQTGDPKKEPGMMLFGWGADWPSGFPFLQPIFDGRQIPPQGNYNLAQYDDPKVNAEFDEIAKITDPAQAAKRYGQLDAQLGKQALTVPLYTTKDLVMYGKNVQNAFVSDWTGKYDVAMLSVK